MFVGTRPLKQYSIEIGLIDKDTECFSGVQISTLKGKDVVGILPLHLACYANTFTVIPLNTKRNMDLDELTIEDVRELATAPKTYKIRKVK